MFAHRFFPATYFAPHYFAPVVAAASTATGSRGRRLVRWLVEMPSIENPVGQWIRQREDDEELFIL